MSGLSTTSKPIWPEGRRAPQGVRDLAQSLRGRGGTLEANAFDNLQMQIDAIVNVLRQPAPELTVLPLRCVKMSPE